MCPALSEHYRYKADLRACRRISSPLCASPFTLWRVERFLQELQNLKNYAVVTVQGPGGGCGYRKYPAQPVMCCAFNTARWTMFSLIKHVVWMSWNQFDIQLTR